METFLRYGGVFVVNGLKEKKKKIKKGGAGTGVYYKPQDRRKKLGQNRTQRILVNNFGVWRLFEINCR